MELYEYTMDVSIVSPALSYSRSVLSSQRVLTSEGNHVRFVMDLIVSRLLYDHPDLQPFFHVASVANEVAERSRIRSP